MQEDPARARFRQHFDLRRALRALGDEVRLEIVHMLATGAEINVTDLAATLLISQPLVSWHLAILRRNGLVRTRRQGRQVYCSLDAARCQQSLRQLGDVISGAPATSAAASAPATVVATVGEADATNTSGTAAGKPAEAKPAQQF